MWTRLEGLAARGVTLQVVYWLPEGMGEDDAASEIGALPSDVVVLIRKRRLWQAFHPLYPPRVLACAGIGRRTGDLARKVRTFAPNAILLDGWVAFLSARRLCADLDLPLIYRSQNHEAAYWRQLVKAARGVNRLKLFLTATRMASTERAIMRAADLVLEISDADRVERPSRARASLVVRPVFRERRQRPASGVGQPPPQAIDVLSVGNLETPNNVEGVRWFLGDVLPRMRDRRSLRVVVAGSNPVRDVLAACREAGVECVANPADILPYLDAARVLVNPVQRGSGVGLKMVDMLATSAPIVSTPAGVRGLPAELVALVAVRHDAGAFAGAVDEALAAPPIAVEQRHALLQLYFGGRDLDLFVERLKTIARQPSV